VIDIPNRSEVDAMIYWHQRYNYWAICCVFKKAEVLPFKNGV